MFKLLDGEDKQILNFYDLVRISEQMKYNLSEEEIQDVINNVAGFGRSEITW
jgi:Ca2+-binding EF-hand superfamily protein